MEFGAYIGFALCDVQQMIKLYREWGIATSITQSIEAKQTQLVLSRAKEGEILLDISYGYIYIQ